MQAISKRVYWIWGSKTLIPLLFQIPVAVWNKKKYDKWLSKHRRCSIFLWLNNLFPLFVRKGFKFKCGMKKNITYFVLYCTVYAQYSPGQSNNFSDYLGLASQSLKKIRLRTLSELRTLFIFLRRNTKSRSSGLKVSKYIKIYSLTKKRD